MKFQKVKDYWEVVKDAAGHFGQYNGMKLAAALSYYTVFSIGPLLVLIISFAGIFFGRQAVEGKIYGQIKGLVGSDAAAQIQSIIQNIHQTHHTVAGSVIGFVVLLIGASGVFSEVQGSINYLWDVSGKPKKQLLWLITTRLLSFSILGGIGFLLLVSLVVNALVDVLSERLSHFFPEYIIYLFYILNVAIIMIIITCLFAFIFKVLPNAVIRWKDAFMGSLFTAVLFLIGKFIIGFYLGNSKVGATYGATASIVVIMLWVYYSSIILYFGAAFTCVYATKLGKGIHAKDNLVQSKTKPLAPAGGNLVKTVHNAE